MQQMPSNETDELALRRQRGIARPAPQDPDSEGLPLEAEAIELAQGTVELRLRAGEGRAVVRLESSSPVGLMGMNHGEGELLAAEEPGRGHPFVAAVARWLGVPVPEPSRGAQSLPLRLSYLNLGGNDEWDAFKLTVRRASRYFEVNLKVSRDRCRARLLEKNPDHRQSLIALLGLALQGAPRRRTPSTDPLMASTEALFGPMRPPAGVTKLRGLAALNDGFLGAEAAAGDTKKSVLLWWADPEKPPERLATLDGMVRTIVPSPSGAWVALIAEHWKGAEWDPSSTQTLVLLERKGWRHRPLTTGPSHPGFLQVIWSGPSDQLACTIVPSDDHGLVTRVYEVPSGRDIAATEPSLRALPASWSPRGWFLQSFGTAGDVGLLQYLWQAGAGALRRLRADQGGAESFDGRFRVSVRADALVIVQTGGTRLVKLTTPDDESILEMLRFSPSGRWLSVSRLVFDLDDPVALDLQTGRLQYLFSEDLLQFNNASPDGGRVTAWTDTGHYLAGVSGSKSSEEK
jgi:hypothetical protein